MIRFKRQGLRPEAVRRLWLIRAGVSVEALVGFGAELFQSGVEMTLPSNYALRLHSTRGKLLARQVFRPTK
jgi:hypothetical protein